MALQLQTARDLRNRQFFERRVWHCYLDGWLAKGSPSVWYAVHLGRFNPRGVRPPSRRLSRKPLAPRSATLPAGPRPRHGTGQPKVANTMKNLFRAVCRARRPLLACAGGALGAGLAEPANRIIVPYTPGGYTDLMARWSGRRFPKRWASPSSSRTSRAPTPSRHQRRRQGGARRLHLRHRDRGACGQRHAQSEAALRHAEGFLPRLADERRAADHDRASLVAGEQRARS